MIFLRTGGSSDDESSSGSDGGVEAIEEVENDSTIEANDPPHLSLDKQDGWPILLYILKHLHRRLLRRPDPYKYLIESRRISKTGSLEILPFSPNISAIVRPYRWGSESDTSAKRGGHCRLWAFSFLSLMAQDSSSVNSLASGPWSITWLMARDSGASIIHGIVISLVSPKPDAQNPKSKQQREFLLTLHRHSIFQPSPLKPEQTDSEWEVVPHPSAEADLVPLKKQRMAMRDKEIIIATGKEVRLANLSGDGFEDRDGVVGKFTTLTSPNLTFDILSIVLSPNGRLLAVVGRSQIIVLVLPRPGSATRGETACKSIIIDSPQYSSSSATGIAKVLWHPLGQGGESLWILSTDGQLREYDIQSPYDPIQTFSFLPSTPASSSRFSAVDPLSRVATSFTFGPATRAGWGECIVYGLLANGDLYTLCPVLPLRAEVPIKWVQRLKAYISQEGSEEEKYWLESLSKQIKLEGPATPSSPEMRTSILGRSTRNTAEAEEKVEVDGEKVIVLHPPHLTASGGPAPGVHMEVERQGPTLLDPASPEGDEEDVASALILLSVKPESRDEKSEGNGKGEVTVLGLCWSGGRVDIGIEVQRVQGKWVGSSVPKSKSQLTIPLIESIQLGVPEHLSSDNAPSFSLDPLHSDTFYIQHVAGVDGISVLGAVSAVLSGSDDIPNCDIAQLVSTSSTKSQSIEALATCYNFSLGYGILALTSDNRLAAIELDYRGTDNKTAESAPSPSQESAPEKADRSSLLTSNPFDLPSLLNTLQPSQSLLSSRKAIGKLTTARHPLCVIGAEHLRAIGDMTLNLQTRIDAIRSASQAVERHLDLQIQEFQRQLQTLQKSSIQLEAVKEHNPIKRAEGMMKRQGELAGRMDKVLSGLTGMYRPPIGEVEKGWFRELEEVRVKVEGAKGYGINRGGGLKMQVEELEDQIDDIKPSAEEMNKELQTATHPRAKVGAKQVRPIESALYAKMDEIGRLMRKMEGLKVKVEEALDLEAA